MPPLDESTGGVRTITSRVADLGAAESVISEEEEDVEVVAVFGSSSELYASSQRRHSCIAKFGCGACCSSDVGMGELSLHSMLFGSGVVG